MTRKPDVTRPETTPPTGDSFTLPSDGDAFTPPTLEQEVQLWIQLRQLFDTLVGRAATAKDREQADNIVQRIGLDPVICPLFLAGVRESYDLKKVIAAGEGMEAKAAELRREIGHFLTVAAGDPERNKEVALERERLTAQHAAASKLADAAARAERQLRHLKLWFWPLFSADANPFAEEKNFLGETKRSNAGALAGTLVPPKVAAVSADLGINPYIPESWKNLRRPEPTPARRRYRTQQLTSPSPITALGQSPRF